MTRRRLLRAAAASVVVAAVVIGALVARSGAPASPRGPKDLTGSIVVIGTGGLAWTDISAETTPALWSLLRNGATADLSVRSVHANTCPVDGWLTLSAGEQAGDGPTGAASTGSDSRPPCRALPDRMAAGVVPHWDQYQAAASANSFEATLGLLGDQVASHGGCIQAVGPGAALGAARSSGIVDRYQAYDDSALVAALAACPATLIDVGPVRDPAEVNPQDELRPVTTRAQQVEAIDARVAAVLKAAPSGSDVVLASLADAGVTERLRLVAVSGPRFGAGTLKSASTRALGLVQLADLTPTIFEHLGIPRPAQLGGAPLEFVPAGGNSDQAAAERLRALLDYDQASHAVHGLVEPFFYSLVLLQIAIYLVAALLWRRRTGDLTRLAKHGSRRMPQSTKLLRVTRRVAIVASTVPVSTFLANVLPWWRFSVPFVSIVASVAVFATLISILALLGPWRRSLFGPVVVVCAVTMAVLAADVMTGSRLQLSSLMGLQPVIGGRFYGMGNVTFALFATATLILCTVVGNHLVPVMGPRLAAAAVATIGMVAVIVDASPSWGSDAGGPPALLPGVILLVLAILQIRLTWRRLLAVGGAVIGFIVVLSLLDWLRPAESRSHLGRFVQTTFDGGAWAVISRKLDQNVSLLESNPLSWLIPFGLVLLAYLLARPDSRLARPLSRSFRRVPLLRTGLIAVLTMWIIGFVLNDSGTAIPPVGVTLAFPLVIAVALKTAEDEMLAGPATTRASLRLR
ncbi:MAG: hypothetical protein ABI438_04555 [Dermatophilaceae bacterium]